MFPDLDCSYKNNFPSLITPETNDSKKKISYREICVQIIELIYAYSYTYMYRHNMRTYGL